MTGSDVSLLVRVARLHFEQGESQKRISEMLRLSPATVSRLVRRAADEGIVRFQIVDPRETGDDLESLADRLRHRLRLRQAWVVPAGKDRAATAGLVARAAAGALAANLKPGVTIGVSGGRAVHATVAQLRDPGLPARAPGARVVQLMGGVASLTRGVHASEVTADLAARLGGTAHKLHGPAILEDHLAVRSLLRNRLISDTVRLFRALDVALVGIGTLDADAPLIESGFLTRAQIERLRGRGVAGDVCGRFLTAAGEPCDAELDGRTLAIPLPDLRAVPLVLAVAFGREKTAAIQAVARVGVMHGLVTDQDTATWLLEETATG